METNSYFTISVLNLYKGCHMNKTFEDVKKFRQYMKKQAEKGHNNVSNAKIQYTDYGTFGCTNWIVVLMPTYC